MYRILLTSLMIIALSFNLYPQAGYYFPPTTSDSWQTTDPELLGWNTDEIDSLYNFLDEKNSKAFIVLHKGKIVLEKYFGTFTKDSLWYWASAGKTITAFLIGKAQEEGYLSISDTTSKYLGEGWTDAAPDKEEKITIWNQLTMTTGFETMDVDWDCTDPECLIYRTDAGERWFYHNAPYTLLKEVLEEATGKNINQLTREYLYETMGMGGAWIPAGWNNVYFSTPRDMAKFGLMILANATWAVKDILNSKTYLEDMTSPSQELNPAYGYLFWLNGSENYIQPGLGVSFEGSIIPDGPEDLFAGMGKNDQRMYIVPSMDLVVIRMGNAADDSFLAVSGFDNDLWTQMNKIFSEPVSSFRTKSAGSFIYPNPAGNYISIDSNLPPGNITIFDLTGKKILEEHNIRKLNISSIPPGYYYLQITTPENIHTAAFVKQ